MFVISWWMKVEVHMPCGCNVKVRSVSLHVYGGRLKVNLDGTVIDNFSDEVLPTKIKDGKVFVLFNKRFLRFKSDVVVEMELGFLMALAFKKTNVPLSHLNKLSVGYVDGNLRNVNPDNLVWYYPSGGLECSFWPGFYYVPGFSNYAISKEGKFISLREGAFKTEYIGSHEYIEFTVSKDCGGSQTIGLQRLLGLTFKDYPVNVRNLVVNHINAVRSDYALSNLEWATYAENNWHGKLINGKSYVTLRNGAVQVKNLYTNEILSFGSMTECANHFDCDVSLVYRAIRRHDGKTIFKQKFVIKAFNQDWPNVSLSDINNRSLSGGRPVLVKCLQTGEVTRYPKATAFIVGTGLSKKVITKNLRLNKQVILNGLLFKYEDNPNDWIS